MSYVARSAGSLVGKSIGNGQCVAFARAAASMGHTSTWRRGALVRGAKLEPGTAIATFDASGRYMNDTHGKSHAAIYLGQDEKGLRVLDQWVEKRHKPDGTVSVRVQPVHERTIRFASSAKPVNDGRNYYVVE